MLEGMVNRTAQFSAGDKDVAKELISIASAVHVQSDYTFFVYEAEGTVLGYYCVGRRPLTDGTYDLYWIVVDPAAAGKGIGKELLRHAETYVGNLNGRWLLAETSSKESYTGTQKFYEKNGYRLLVRIDDFYTAGDDLMVFGKRTDNNVKG